jgi:hypothetical protein
MPSIEQFVLPSVVLAGIITLIAAAFLSRRNRWLLFGCLSCAFLVALPLLYERYHFTKPNRRDRAAQRQTVAARVAQAGGWIVLEQECRAFVEAAPRYDGKPGGAWREAPTNFPALAILQPRKITVGSLRGGGSYVCIELFGMHSTGGRGIPFYWLAVPSKEIQNVGELGFNLGRLNCVTNLVYEIF